MEGEDAIVTCKIDSNSPSAIWLKDSNEIMVNKDCIMSTVTEKLKRVLQLTLKNTKASDSGEYCVKVGKYSRKLQIKIIGIEEVKKLLFTIQFRILEIYAWKVQYQFERKKPPMVNLHFNFTIIIIHIITHKDLALSQAHNKYQVQVKPSNLYSHPIRLQRMTKVNTYFYSYSFYTLDDFCIN